MFQEFSELINLAFNVVNVVLTAAGVGLTYAGLRRTRRRRRFRAGK